MDLSHDALKADVRALIQVLEHPAMVALIIPALASYDGPTIDMVRLKQMVGYDDEQQTRE